uniref:High-affinity nitrate transporter n=1 Tax=Rhizophora mucronata TaxID=61149 RepID=A0A2P2IU67_RHIMU
MAARGLLLASVLLSFLASFCHGNVHFSSLSQTLLVTASPKPGQVLKAGVDRINLTWGLNQTLSAGTDSTYKTIKVKLCYAPISQVDRGWRKTEDNLSKDKTCQFTIVAGPYNSADRDAQTREWTIERDVPTATYFVRAFAYDSQGQEVAYGQTTDAHKATNLFEVHAISGRHVPLDIASACFSAFSIVTLFGFFLHDKRKAKSIQAR